MPFMPKSKVERRLTRSVSPFQRLRVSHGVPKGACAARTRASKRTDGGVIKIDIGQRGEQTVHQQAVDLVASGGPGLLSASWIRAQISSSCSAAVSGCLPHTPVRTQPLLPAVCWH